MQISATKTSSKKSKPGTKLAKNSKKNKTNENELENLTIHLDQEGKIYKN